MLTLRATLQGWSASPFHGTAQEDHPRLRALRDRVLARDANVCQGCGFACDKWQEIHHRDGDHRNHRERNLETRCPLCHQLDHLPTASATGGGAIIWLPEIPQDALNRLLIGLFAVMRQTSPSHPWQGHARSLFALLESRRTVMNDQLGSSDPAMLAQVLLRRPQEQGVRIVEPLRLLAYPTRFPQAIDYWSATAGCHGATQDTLARLWPESIPLQSVFDIHERLKQGSKSSGERV